MTQTEELVVLATHKGAWCEDCSNWKQYCKCLTASQRFERARLLAQEAKRWTDEASVQGGLRRTAEQAQLRALDLAHRAQQELIELLNDTRGESKTENLQVT